MRRFSWEKPSDFTESDSKEGSSSIVHILNIIDPSKTEDRMTELLKTPEAFARAMKKFNEKIKNSTQHAVLGHAAGVADYLAKLGSTQKIDKHTHFYFQQFIPTISFDSSGAPPTQIKIKSDKVDIYTIPERLKASPYARDPDGADVLLMNSTDQNADLFLLYVIATYKHNNIKIKNGPQLRALYQLWDIYSPVLSELINHPKAIFNYPRPTDPQYLDPPPTPSYPGGHATAAAGLATLLFVTSGLPATGEGTLCEILGKAATYIADLRVMAGIHFQEDTDAGLQLGHTVMLKLLEYTIKQDSSSELAKLLQFACNGP